MKMTKSDHCLLMLHVYKLGPNASETSVNIKQGRMNPQMKDTSKVVHETVTVMSVLKRKKVEEGCVVLTR